MREVVAVWTMVPAFAVAVVRTTLMLLLLLLLEEVAGEVKLAVSVATRGGGAVDSHCGVEDKLIRR